MGAHQHAKAAAQPSINTAISSSKVLARDTTVSLLTHEAHVEPLHTMLAQAVIGLEEHPQVALQILSKRGDAAIWVLAIGTGLCDFAL